VNEAGKQADGLEFGLYESLARKGELIIAVDVRGVGETKPPHSQNGERRNEFSARSSKTSLRSRAAADSTSRILTATNWLCGRTRLART
jgi:hypothetical protein